jgi:hypothetical protein
MSPLSLVKRLVKGSKLTAAEFDGNMGAIESAVNTLNTRTANALNDDGTLKSAISAQFEIVNNGPTASRPATPSIGTKYFDTDISVELIYERAAWRTASGSPGDTKYVTASSLTTALTINPGWIQDTASQGRVQGGAGTGSGLSIRSVGDAVGEETHLQTIAELVNHKHSSNAAGLGTGTRIAQAGNTSSATDPLGPIDTTTVGGSTPFNVMQPTIFRYCLVKQ